MGKRKVQNKPSQTAPSAEGGEDKKEESKTKGKKTYSLQQQKGAAAQSGDAETSELPKVRLPDKLESALIEQIGEEQRSRQGQRDVSKRLTSKKLTDVYDSLLGTGFSRTQVEAAMSNCIMGGGDLIDALDWLCLNTQNDQLPAGFSETLQKEEEKRRPKFDLSLHEEKDLRLVASQDSGGEKGETSSGGKSTRSETPSAKTDKGGGGGGMKNWILQYAEQSSEEEEEDEGGDASSFNPTKRYADLHRQLQEVKSQAAIAKSSGATEKHKTLSKQLKEMHIEMSSLEKHPAFDKSIKSELKAAAAEAVVQPRRAEDVAREKMMTSAAAQEEKKKKEEDEEEETEDSFGLGLFAQAEKEPVAKPSVVTKPESEDVREEEEEGC